MQLAYLPVVTIIVDHDNFKEEGETPDMLMLVIEQKFRKRLLVFILKIDELWLLQTDVHTCISEMPGISFPGRLCFRKTTLSLTGGLNLRNERTHRQDSAHRARHVF